LVIDDHQADRPRALGRQGKATRTRLLPAAVPALAGNGYHAARVDDVARTAGVSHGTFYLYFANMEDLFRALAEQCADEADTLAESLGRVDLGFGDHRLLDNLALVVHRGFFRAQG
jgi:AcrR family transcriptional regulator